MTKKISLKQNIIKHVRKTGFPTELKVGMCFAEAGRELSYNVYYIDKDENKSREIDIIATYVFPTRPAHQLYLCHSSICSVKKSEKPWVIFSNDTDINTEDPGWRRMLVCDKVDDKILPYEDLSRNSSLSRFERFGHAYNIAFTESNKEIYDALCSTVKASESYLEFVQRIIDEDEREHPMVEDKLLAFSLFEPIIILDGKMYEAFFNKNNRLVVREVNHIPVNFGYFSNAYHHNDEFGNFIVEIVTLQKLPEFIKIKDIWLAEIAKTILRNSNKNDNNK